MKKIRVDSPVERAFSESEMSASLQNTIEAAINRRLAKKLGCKPEEVDLMLPSEDGEPVQ